MLKIFLWLFPVILLVQCSNNEPRFNFWIGGAPEEIDYWEELVNEFEEDRGYDIQVVRQPTDSDQRRQGLVISLESRQPDPDVFLMDVVWIGQFAKSNWLQPLDSFIEASNFSLDPFFQRVIELVDRYEGQLYGLPVYVDGGLLYYRSDLLEKYGYDSPPETWMDLLNYSLQIQEEERKVNPGFNGFVWQGAQYEGLVCTFLEFTASNGGGILIDNRFQLNHPRNKHALEFMRNLIHQYRISPQNIFTEMKEEEVRQAFQRGNALFERNWPYAWKSHQSENSPVKGKVGIAPLPHFENGQPASTLGGWHIAISRYSDVKDKAWDFLQYITSYEIQKKLVLRLGWNPGRVDVYSDSQVLDELPHLKRLQDVFNYAVARPTVPYYNQISETIQRYANSSLAGRMTPERALQKMQEEINEITRLYEAD